MEENFRFKVNLGGMIDILANHLYSSPDVFLRELLQNGVDAIRAKELTDKNWKDGKIEIDLYEGSTIVFHDNGTGLTKDEIHKFLSIIGQSSKKDLITGNIIEDYIGRFGIGMLSCFMVSNEIVVHTNSEREDKSWEWRGKPDGTYSIKELTEGCSKGTTIYLKSKEDYKHYFKAEKIRNLINHYGMLLPFPIILNYNGISEQLNMVNLPWDKEIADRNEIMVFGEKIFNQQFLDYIPLYSKNGNVKGVAYILPYKVHSNVKNNHKIYLKNMLLTENGSDILPEWAFFVKCILNTTQLRPTASREGFYEDEMLESARESIAKCISAYLSYLAKSDEVKLEKIIRIHQLAIKSMAVENDELFEIFFDYLTFETTKGDMTGREIKNYNQIVVYTYDIDKFKQMSQIFTAQNKLLLNSGYVYETELIEKAKEIYNINIVPLNDDELEYVMEDVTIVEQEKVFDLIKTANKVLKKFDCEAEIKHFKPVQLPIFYTINENAKLLRDITRTKEKSSALFLDMLNAFAEEIKEDCFAKIYFNIDNPLIKGLMEIQNLDKLAVCIEILYVQAILLGRFPLRNNEMEVMNTGILRILQWGIRETDYDNEDIK